MTNSPLLFLRIALVAVLATHAAVPVISSDVNTAIGSLDEAAFVQPSNSLALSASTTNASDSERRLDLLDESKYYVVSACGIDIVGGDYVNSKPAPAIACVLWCQSTPGCRMMTWTDYQGGTCWFKTGDGSYFKPKTGAYSMLWFEYEYYPNGYMYVDQTNCDMPGNDFMSVKETRVERCAAKCNTNPRCWAFSWNDYQGGTCWFKTQATTCVPKAGVNSYYLFKKGAVSGKCAFALGR